MEDRELRLPHHPLSSILAFTSVASMMNHPAQRVEAKLDYAQPGGVRPLTPWRVVLWAVYYAGWVGGWAILATSGGVVAFAALRPPGIDDDVTLFVGPAVGVVTGVALAILSRRTRWPQFLLASAGAVASVPFAAAAWKIFGGSRPMGWDAVTLEIYCILLVNALCFLFAGTAGVLLTRRNGA